MIFPKFWSAAEQLRTQIHEYRAERIKEVEDCDRMLAKIDQLEAEMKQHEPLFESEIVQLRVKLAERDAEIARLRGQA